MIEFFILMIFVFLISLYVLHKLLFSYVKQKDKNYKLWNIYYWEFLTILSIGLTFGIFHVFKAVNLFPF